MYIVSTTFVVEPAVHTNWYALLTDKFLPSIEGRHIVFTQVLNEQSDGHHTYSMQVDVADIADYQSFRGEQLSEFIELCCSLFGESVLHFTTLLKKIQL